MATMPANRTAIRFPFGSEQREVILAGSDMDAEYFWFDDDADDAPRLICPASEQEYRYSHGGELYRAAMRAIEAARS